MDNMSEQPWMPHVEDLNTEVVAAYIAAAGAFWPSVAITAALIDKNILAKKDLLDIVDAFIDHVSAETYPNMGDPDDNLLALQFFALTIRELDLVPGAVLPEIQALAAKAKLTLLLWESRERRRKPKSPEA